MLRDEHGGAVLQRLLQMATISAFRWRDEPIIPEKSEFMIFYRDVSQSYQITRKTDFRSALLPSTVSHLPSSPRPPILTTETMDSIENEYLAMRRRHQKAIATTDEAITSIETFLQTLCPSSTADSSAMDVDTAPDEATSSPTATTTTTTTADEVLTTLRRLLKVSKSLQSSLVADHKSLGAAINKLGKAVDAETAQDLGKLCAPSIRLNTQKINEAIAAHLFREGMFEVGRTFSIEASVLLDDDNIRPFERLHIILKAFRAQDLQPAIIWTREQADMLKNGNSHLEFRLHRLAYLQILERGDRTAALDYARKHFSAFPEHIKSVQKLMTCLLYASSLSESPYKDMVSAAHRDDIERALSREYCRAQGFSLDSSLVTVVRCGTKAIPTLLKASKFASSLQELGMDDALPVEIDIGRDCQFHSIFTCPVSKEEACEGTNAPMMLPCKHVLSKQSINRLPRGSLRFKCPYCPMEQVSSECRELHF